MSKESLRPPDNGVRSVGFNSDVYSVRDLEGKVLLNSPSQRSRVHCALCNIVTKEEQTDYENSQRSQNKQQPSVCVCERFILRLVHMSTLRDGSAYQMDKPSVC